MKKKRAQNTAPRCPYCGSHSVLRSADGIYRCNDKNTMLYVCSRYPACDSYVRVHPGTKIPVGTMANQELRALRNEAHRNFDQLHKKGLMSKEDSAPSDDDLRRRNGQSSFCNRGRYAW